MIRCEICGSKKHCYSILNSDFPAPKKEKSTEDEMWYEHRALNLGGMSDKNFFRGIGRETPKKQSTGFKRYWGKVKQEAEMNWKALGKATVVGSGIR